MNPDRSLKSMLVFLEICESKGWIKPATARSWNQTCQRVLSGLEEEETADVSKIDVEVAIRKYGNLNQDAGPNSLRVYKARLNSAIRNFLAYSQDRLKYKPDVQTRGGADQRPKRTSEKTNDTDNDSTEQPTVEGTLCYPLMLRSGMLIKLVGIPADLNARDIERISSYLKSLILEDGK